MEAPIELKEPILRKRKADQESSPHHYYAATNYDAVTRSGVSDASAQYERLPPAQYEQLPPAPTKRMRLTFPDGDYVMNEHRNAELQEHLESISPSAPPVEQMNLAHQPAPPAQSSTQYPLPNCWGTISAGPTRVCLIVMFFFFVFTYGIQKHPSPHRDQTCAIQ